MPTFNMAMPSESMDVEYLLQIVKLYHFKRSCKLTWSLVVPPQIQCIIAWSLRCRQCRSEEFGPRFCLHAAWCYWHTNCKLFFWGWWEMSGRWGWAGAHYIAPCDTASCDGSGFTTTYGWAVSKYGTTSGFSLPAVIFAGLTLFHDLY